MSAREAIVRMKKGDLTFYTTGDGERADVQIGNSLLSPFRTTAPDDMKLNNLDSIAANNPVPLAWDQYPWSIGTRTLAVWAPSEFVVCVCEGPR